MKLSWWRTIIILINNLSEAKVVYGLAENYIIRVLSIFEERWWMKLQFPILEKTSRGQIIYWENTFKSHIIEYQNIIWYIKYQLSINNHLNSEDKRELLFLLNNIQNELMSFNDSSDNRFTLEKAYSLFSNEIINNWLLNLPIIPKSISLLPADLEFSWNEFRDTFFKYINTRDIKREWPWSLSWWIPSLL